MTAIQITRAGFFRNLHHQREQLTCLSSSSSLNSGLLNISSTSTAAAFTVRFSGCPPRFLDRFVATVLLSSPSLRRHFARGISAILVVLVTGAGAAWGSESLRDDSRARKSTCSTLRV